MATSHSSVSKQGILLTAADNFYLFAVAHIGTLLAIGHPMQKDLQDALVYLCNQIQSSLVSQPNLGV